MIRIYLARVFIALSCIFSAVPAAAQTITILTAGTAGVYYPVGVQLKEIFEQAIPGAAISVRATQGTVENLNLLQRGTGELAFAQGDIVAAAMEGNPVAGFPSSRNKLRLIAAAYPNYIHLIARSDSGIDSIGDLVGKRVSVGAARSGNELNARALLGAVGLSYADLLDVEYLHYAESVEGMLNGGLDAAIVSAGLGVKAVVAALEHGSIKLVPIAAEVVQANPRMFYPTFIPANAYPGQPDAVPTAALNNYFVTSADVPEQLVHDMTRAIFTNLDALRSRHRALEPMTLENALSDRPIELHQGAQRYFRSIGMM